MPIYLMRCDSCHAEKDVYRTVSKIDENLPNCCGEPMHRKICSPYIIQDIKPYKSMVTGETISSRSRHKEHLKSHGLIEVGNELPKDRQVEKKDAIKDDIKKDLYEVMNGFGF